MILDTAIDAVGHTPLIRLDKIARKEKLKCNLLAKVEYFSAGGSVKDRIAKLMVEEAEKDGILIPNKSIVIEPTSGNTGIGLAFICAIKGYPVIITLPEKMSLEKEATLRALGAEVIRTPTDAPSESPESNIGAARLAKRLQKEIPNAVILDQYRNVNNPMSHEATTGPEIIEDVVSTPSTPQRPSSGRVDAFVAGVGTGGTITGVSRALKKRHSPNCFIIGIDPKGSILAEPSSLNDDGGPASYVVEGIGYDFIPDVLSREPGTVDHWIKTSDNESFDCARELIKTEGLLVGGSSGSVLAGALRWLKSEAGWTACGGVEGSNVVLLFPDGIRNYMSKPWFLEIVHSPASELRKQVDEILAKTTRPVVPGASSTLGNSAAIH